jgi:uncharacterized protein (TIGR03118 family)
MRRQTSMIAKPRALIAVSILTSGLAGCHGGSDDPAPMLSFAVAPQTITIGQTATLTWSSNEQAPCGASGGWTGAQPATGTMDVTPTATGSVTYMLTCPGTSMGSSTTRSVTLTILPASAYVATSLVEDQAGGTALATDDHLVNPWGIAYGPITAMVVANNRSETSTIYDGNGQVSTLVTQFVPSAGADEFEATGIVFNGTSDFVVGDTVDNRSPARFVFDGEGGMIAGWSLAVDFAHAITVYTATDGAVYKGLAIASNENGNFLYATDFANGKIDVFDGEFTKQVSTPTSFAFDDPALPEGYSPFGIQAIENGAGGATQIYVTYAKHDTAEPDDDAPGPGLGLVNAFDTNGRLLKHLVAEGGRLNVPWGIALAPADFGTLGDALLVGNFGDGTIHGYDPSSGRYLGEVTDGTGAAFAVPGLWGMKFGNDAVNQPHATLFFAAGTNDEVNGRYGRIDLGPNAPALGRPPSVTLIAPEGDLSGTVTLTAIVTSPLAITKVQFFVSDGTLIGTATSEPFTVQWDTTTVSNDSALLRAVATDGNGNVGSSYLVEVTVANPAVAATLSQIQQSVLTPRCATCHDGSQPAGGALPGAMDLRSGHSFVSLVNVASLEQPTLMRVKPNEPESSYVIRKLKGSAGISGERMPLGGPFLDQTTIDEIESWIVSGAPND